MAAAVNSAMVTAYWEIGEKIYKACGENDRAEYGKKLLQFLSEHLTAEFGQGYTVRNLRAMRQFYCCFPIRHTLCAELGSLSKNFQYAPVSDIIEETGV